jgi:hypothetical protein
MKKQDKQIQGYFDDQICRIGNNNGNQNSEKSYMRVVFTEIYFSSG